MKPYHAHSCASHLETSLKEASDVPESALSLQKRCCTRVRRATVSELTLPVCCDQVVCAREVIHSITDMSKSPLYCSDIVKYGEAIRDNKIVTNKKSREKELEGAEADRWEMAAALLRRVRISRGAQQLQLRSSGGSEQKAVWRGGIRGLAIPSGQKWEQLCIPKCREQDVNRTGTSAVLHDAKAVEWLSFSQTPPKSHCAQLFPVFA